MKIHRIMYTFITPSMNNDRRTNGLQSAPGDKAILFIYRVILVIDDWNDKDYHCLNKFINGQGHLRIYSDAVWWNQ